MTDTMSDKSNHLLVHLNQYSYLSCFLQKLLRTNQDMCSRFVVYIFMATPMLVLQFIVKSFIIHLLDSNELNIRFGMQIKADTRLHISYRKTTLPPDQLPFNKCAIITVQFYESIIMKKHEAQQNYFHTNVLFRKKINHQMLFLNLFQLLG